MLSSAMYDGWVSVWFRARRNSFESPAPEAPPPPQAVRVSIIAAAAPASPKNFVERMCLPVSCPHRGICKGAVPRPTHLALGTPPPSVAGPCHNPWSQTKLLYCNKLPLVACVTFMPWRGSARGRFAGAASRSVTPPKSRQLGPPVYRGPSPRRGQAAAGPVGTPSKVANHTGAAPNSVVAAQVAAPTGERVSRCRLLPLVVLGFAKSVSGQQTVSYGRSRG